MKHKLEFPLFYLLWATACIQLTFSIGAAPPIPTFVLGAALLATTFSFGWAASGTDDIVSALLKPTIGMLVLAAGGFAIFSRSLVGSGSSLVSLLVLMQIERGYTYERTYEA